MSVALFISKSAQFASLLDLSSLQILELGFFISVGEIFIFILISIHKEVEKDHC